MNTIAEFLSNPWVVGIGGGLISGLLVTVITRYLFSKREQREYRQRVETANNEIIYAIRPTIAEKVIPSSPMLDALLNATARKYQVNRDDLFSKIGLADELIKEVMDNSFLSSQQKVEFCDLLSKLKEPKDDKKEKQKIEIITVTKRESFDPSMILGMTTAVVAMVTTMFVYLKERELFSEQLLRDKLLPMLIVITIVPVFISIIFDVFKKIKWIRESHIKSHINIKEDDKEDEESLTKRSA